MTDKNIYLYNVFIELSHRLSLPLTGQMKRLFSSTSAAIIGVCLFYFIDEFNDPSQKPQRKQTTDRAVNRSMILESTPTIGYFLLTFESNIRIYYE